MDNQEGASWIKIHFSAPAECFPPKQSCPQHVTHGWMRNKNTTISKKHLLFWRWKSWASGKKDICGAEGWAVMTWPDRGQVPSNGDMSTTGGRWTSAYVCLRQVVQYSWCKYGLIQVKAQRGRSKYNSCSLEFMFKQLKSKMQSEFLQKEPLDAEQFAWLVQI